MTVLGIGGIGTSEAACAIVVDGELRAAVEEKKLRSEVRRLPQTAIKTCLDLAKTKKVDLVAVARRAEEWALDEMRAALPGVAITLVDHHLAHAASSFCASGFSDATVLTVDSGDDLVTAQLWSGSGSRLTSQNELLWPDSVGALYSRVTELLGFHRGADEHKVQWLSTSGDDRFVGAFESVLGEPWMPMNRAYLQDKGFLSRALSLQEDASIPANLQPHIAAGVQRAVEKYLLRMAGSGENLCLAGGVFFNALLVRAFETSGLWKNVFVQPAAGNSGTAIGAAYAAATDPAKPMRTLAVGPEYSAEEIKKVLENCKLGFRYMITSDEAIETALRLLGDHKIVAWMQGRMEFGPRALGNRSILASPLDPYSSENLNVYIKHREAFRKFAASVPAEHAGEYFETGPNARNLATISRVKEAHRTTFRTVLMGDGLARVHVVHAQENPLFHRLLIEFGKKYGLPVLYNTSFNLFGDPLVCTPRDAVRSFFSSGIDALITGNFLIEK